MRSSVLHQGNATQRLFPALICMFCAAHFLVTSHAGEKPARNRAVVIGINNYWRGGGKLKYCVADAKALRDVLAAGKRFRANDIDLMTDDASEGANKPTFLNIQERLKGLARKPDKTDALLVFFAGHGITVSTTKDGKLQQEAYLRPIDAPLGSGLKLSDVRAWLANSNAAHVLLILDCCHAGEDVRGLSRIVPDLAAGPELVVFASCGAKEQSHDDLMRGHGVFSAHLIDGLAGEADKNKDRNIAVGELFEYVRGNVSDWANKKGLDQVPVRFPDKAPLDEAVIARATKHKPEDNPLWNQLSQLKNPKRKSIKVHVWPDKKRYRIGEPVRISFRVDRDAYVTIFSLQTGGSLLQVLPNPYQRANFVRAGKIASIPTDNYVVDATGPRGTEWIKVIATLSPLQVDIKPFSDLRKSRESLRSLQSELRKLPTSDWGEAETSLEIVAKKSSIVR